VNEPTIGTDTKPMSEMELGKRLGQLKAFGLVAGRCSAEQAAALKRIRDEHAYQCITTTWDEFCIRELRMSRRHANRIIGWFEEFGQAYFELAQLMAVSPEEYRRLEPVVVDHRLQFNGQSIALIPEKAEEVASAVAEMRKRATAARPRVSRRARMATLKRQCEKILAECADLRGGSSLEEQFELHAILQHAITRLNDIDSFLP
jgi:hypothetical protein